MTKQDIISFSAVVFDSADKLYLLRNARVEEFIKLQRINQAQKAAEAELKKNSSEKKQKKIRSR